MGGELKSRPHELELARWARREFRQLGTTKRLNWDKLRDWIGERRGKPLYIDPYPLEANVFGLWLGYKNQDRIFYQSRTVPWHQRHIIFHELGHLLLDHPSDELNTDGLSMLLPELPDSLLKFILRRSCYDEQKETDAEVVASILREWDHRLSEIAPPASQDTARAVDAALIDQILPR